MAKPYGKVFTIIERAGVDTKDHWVKIGAAIREWFGDPDSTTQYSVGGLTWLYQGNDSAELGVLRVWFNRYEYLPYLSLVFSGAPR
jgi:hypothetical protein